MNVALIPTVIAGALAQFNVIKGIDLETVAFSGAGLWAAAYAWFKRRSR